ncbi:MAG TPA: hypothetical protein VJ927_03695 [Actinomycetota bacterium]|nr:hypothetical protein [Actinomycetota bacterium]
MKRRTIALVTAVAAALTLMTGTAAAEPLTEKLFGCEGYVPIACPGPMP